MDDGLIYKTASDIHTAVTAVQEQLVKVSHWCEETESEINPSKAQAVGQAMSAVPFNAEIIVGPTQDQSQIPRDPLRQNAGLQDAG